MGAKIFMAVVLGTGVYFSYLTSPSLAEEGDYEIVKATESVAWRLNKKTGEISACRFSGDAMTCASSDSAAHRPKTSLDELKKERKKERLEMQDEELATLDRLFVYFKKLMRSVKEFEQDYKTKPEKIN